MVTIEFHYIALFAHDDNGVWVLFPSGGNSHTTTIDHGTGDLPLSGKWDTPIVGPTAPAGTRTPDLQDILPDIKGLKTKSIDDLLSNGTIHAAWRLSGGSLEDLEAEFKCEAVATLYRDVRWTIGDAVNPQPLTNRVRWTGPAATWTSDAGDQLVLQDGETTTIANDDQGADVAVPAAGGVIILDDFALLYGLLDLPAQVGAGALPLPTHEFTQMPGTLAGLAAAEALAIGGTRPICPGGKLSASN